MKTLNTVTNLKKYLANLIKQSKEKTMIPAIKESAGKIWETPYEINIVFRKFYENL